jgi:hypothetical protein
MRPFYVCVRHFGTALLSFARAFSLFGGAQTPYSCQLCDEVNARSTFNSAKAIIMKKLFIGIGLLLLILVGLMIWLAGSVGPDTAPQDTRSIPVEIDASR